MSQHCKEKKEEAGQVGRRGEGKEEEEQRKGEMHSPGSARLPIKNVVRNLKVEKLKPSGGPYL